MKNKILMLIGLCAVLFQVSCDHEEHHEERKSEFLVSSPLRKDTSLVVDYVCQIKSIRHIELMAQERGYLTEIFVDEGQTVQKGQLLFQIMPNLYEAEKQKAQAEVSFAEIEFKNTKKLADSNVVAPNELAMAQAKLDHAKAELALAQVHLDFTKIRAPFDGIIDRFHVREGSLLEEGDLLTNLSDNSKMWVYYNVPEAEYLDYQAQVKSDSLIRVSLKLANNKMFPHEGRVETIEADFNNETGNIPFRATFPNPERLLRHGETGSVQMHVPFENALLIPQKATFEVLDKKFVYTITDEGVVVPTEIVVAAELQHLFIVQEGLDENDRILLEGLRRVKANDEISYHFASPDSVINHLNLYAE
ncbi:efflux RND transporter periplasmic adaptor subunit [Cryomorphaceae bacterium 1068]|nr:efflux RND transporter periplasmic adaptor subunit [Cryomorphaceae bacterium 1068]